MPRVDPAADVSSLWLETLQRLVDRAAHEIKGALSGVSLNIEVVRSRSAKPSVPASAVAPYAAAAHQQMEALTALTEALLALSRPMRGRCDVGVLLGRFADLAAPVARASGGELRIGPLPDVGDAVTSVVPDAVRLAVGAAVLAALDAPAQVMVELSTEDGVVVTLRRDGAAHIRLATEIASALADVGVRIEELSDGIVLAFAAHGGAETGET